MEHFPYDMPQHFFRALHIVADVGEINVRWRTVIDRRNITAFFNYRADAFEFPFDFFFAGGKNAFVEAAGHPQFLSEFATQLSASNSQSHSYLLTHYLHSLL